MKYILNKIFCYLHLETFLLNKLTNIPEIKTFKQFLVFFQHKIEKKKPLYAIILLYFYIIPLVKRKKTIQSNS